MRSFDLCTECTSAFDVFMGFSRMLADAARKLMPIIRTGKYLSEEDNKRALSYYREMTGPASGMVITDCFGPWPDGATCPRTDGEIAAQQFHKFVNDAAVRAGLDKPREFIDEDGDEAINNYGVDFHTREILFWEETD